MQVAVIGLGYVGLPLAAAFGAVCPTIGYDRDNRKIARLVERRDATGEVSPEEFAAARGLVCTVDPGALRSADFIIIAVPTPVDNSRRPDLVPLLDACEAAGRNLKRGATVIIESTVYPGCTEEECVPVFERASGLRWREDFHVGYSPERINPGDAQHRLPSITKVVAGDSAQTLERVAQLYERIIKAGVYRAPSIRIAEAAKVIENTQRDLNIALMNELAIIFQRMGIDTAEVLRAAGTKWNFLPFHPGLVGGHCIGVDPYYLTHKAEMLGYHPEVILAGRRINDGMAHFVSESLVKRLAANGVAAHAATAIVAGITFKANCPDVRNSKVADLIGDLRSYGMRVHVHDPCADGRAVQDAYGLTLEAWQDLPRAHVVILAVPHSELLAKGPSAFASKAMPGALFVDLYAAFDPLELRDAGLAVWRL